MAAKFHILKIWRLPWQFGDLSGTNLLSSNVSVFCDTEKNLASLCQQFWIHWKLNSRANVALSHPKKAYWEMRRVGLEMAPHWSLQIPRDCHRAEMHSVRSEQTQALPPRPTQPNSCPPYCKYHLELTSNDFLLLSSRRVPIDPEFKSFPTSNHHDILHSILFQHLSYKEKELQLRLIWNFSLSQMKINNLVVATWFEFWREHKNKTFAKLLFQNMRNITF